MATLVTQVNFEKLVEEVRKVKTLVADNKYEIQGIKELIIKVERSIVDITKRFEDEIVMLKKRCENNEN